MTNALLETQLLVVIFVFFLAVLGKLLSLENRVQLLYIPVEAVLCGLLLLTSHPLARLATSMLMISAAWVLSEMRTLRPGQGCGCFGVLSSSPINRMTVLRTALLAIASFTAFPVPRTGLQILTGLSGAHAALFTAEVALLAAISPETPLLLRRNRVPCERRPVSLRRTLATLHASEAWRRHGLPRDTEPTEVWRELCWRFVVYRVDRKDLVFAVSLSDGEVRAALVPAPDPLPAPARRRSPSVLV